MKRTVVAMAACALAAAPAARAATLSPDAAYIRDCLTAAGNAYHEPPAVLVILLNVEGGRLIMRSVARTSSNCSARHPPRWRR